MSYAVINGIGCTFGDKKFKLINPYEKENKKAGSGENKARVTRDQMLKDMEDVRKMFNK